jgi:hypothetical protein
VTTGGGRTRVTVTDGAGVQKTYDSIDDLPADLRALYEDAIKDRPS